MFYLLVRYLVLVSPRFVFRQAGLVCHRRCLSRQGRCPSSLGTLFDYGRHCSLCARVSGSVARRAPFLGREVARQALLLLSLAGRQGKLAALYASVVILWALTADVFDIARSLTAAARDAYTRVWAQLAAAYFVPASVYARLVAASSATLGAIPLTFSSSHFAAPTRCYLASSACWS